MQNNFYIYEHYRTDTDRCFYVGKGKAYRAYDMISRNSTHKAIQEELECSGCKVDVRIIADNLKQEEAFRLEVERIEFWRQQSVPLANRAGGGHGASGYKRSEAWKKKVGDRHRGKVVSEETRTKISNAQIGRRLSAETRAKISEGAKASWTPERRAVQADHMKRRNNLRAALPTRVGGKFCSAPKGGQS